MTKHIKAWLLRLLGQQAYLQLTSFLFFLVFRIGLLRSKPAYYTHYLVAKLIKNGTVIIDIGANLGYYSVLFARKTGTTGKVFSVEPIELYRNVLKKNIAKFENVLVMPFALGEHEGFIKMGNPSSDLHRHGLMRVLSEEEAEKAQYEVPLKHPLHLFGKIGPIHYIKCDIEGYEVPVIPAMQPLIEYHRPLLQIETEGANKMVIVELLKNMNYSLYYAGAKLLIPYKDITKTLPGDLIAIPTEKLDAYTSLIDHATI